MVFGKSHMHGMGLLSLAQHQQVCTFQVKGLIVQGFKPIFRLYFLTLAKWTHKSMQVNASLQNWNLHMDLRWVAKQIHKSVRKFTQVVNFTHIQMTCDWLVSTYVGWPNGEKLADTFELNESQCKSTQVGDQTKRKSNTSQKLALTSESIWPGLNRFQFHSELYVEWILSDFLGGHRRYPKIPVNWWDTEIVCKICRTSCKLESPRCLKQGCNCIKFLRCVLII